MDVVKSSEPQKHCFILLCGQKGSGKSTLARCLVAEHQFVEFSYASALKDVVSVIYGWPRDKLDGATVEHRAWRETRDIFWSEFFGRDVTPRSELQRMGTDLFRDHFHKDIWTAIVIRRIFALIFSQREKGKPAKIVISDCRFENEIALILNKFVQAEWGGYSTDVHVFMLMRNVGVSETELNRKNGIRIDISLAPKHEDFLQVMKVKYPQEHVSEWETVWMREANRVPIMEIVTNNYLNPLDLLLYVRPKLTLNLVH